MNDLGIGSGMAYEYVVAEKKSALLICKRVSLILFYILWVAVLLIIGLMTTFFVPFLALVPFTLWILAFLTWRFTQVEYELSFFSGQLTVSRIYGGRTRKKLAEVTIRDLAGVYPCNDDTYSQKIDSFGHEKEIMAAGSLDSPDLYAALWRDEDGKKYLLWFEATEKALKVFRFYNASAVVVKKVNK